MRWEKNIGEEKNAREGELYAPRRVAPPAKRSNIFQSGIHESEIEWINHLRRCFLLTYE